MQYASPAVPSLPSLSLSVIEMPQPLLQLPCSGTAHTFVSTFSMRFHSKVCTKAAAKASCVPCRQPMRLSCSVRVVKNNRQTARHSTSYREVVKVSCWAHLGLPMFHWRPMSWCPCLGAGVTWIVARSCLAWLALPWVFRFCSTERTQTAFAGVGAGVTWIVAGVP
jgi:hypothetical protein